MKKHCLYQMVILLPSTTKIKKRTKSKKSNICIQANILQQTLVTVTDKISSKLQITFTFRIKSKLISTTPKLIIKLIS